jgi:hypothetical protein
LAVSGIWSGATWARQIVPPDPTLQAQIQQSIRAADNAHDWGRLVAESHRLLEFFPNEPAVRAPIYLAMAEAAKRAGDNNHAAEYRAAATAIDANLPDRLPKGAEGIDIMQTMLLAMRIASAMPQARLAARTSGKAVGGDSSPSTFYPDTAVGSSAYQPPQGGYLPAPAYDPTPYGYLAITSTSEPPPAPVSAQPPAVPEAPPISIQPVETNTVQRRPPAYPPVLDPKAMLANEQRLSAQAALTAQSTPMAAPRQPYPPPLPFKVLVERVAPVAVIVDRSVAGDAGFFTHACGALLEVADGSLNLTSACGDTPYVIPASEITELQLNTAVGRDAGVFHVATRQGLWLQLELDPASRESSSKLIALLRSALGLPE